MSAGQRGHDRSVRRIGTGSDPLRCFLIGPRVRRLARCMYTVASTLLSDSFSIVPMAPLYDHQTARAYENAPGKERGSGSVEMVGIRGNRPLLGSDDDSDDNQKVWHQA